MGTNDFRDITHDYGINSQVLAKCFKAFSSYIEIPKKEWEKYHSPYKDIVIHVPASIEVCTIDPILPEPYVEKIIFPAKVKEHYIIANVVIKSTKKTMEPDEQINI